MAIMVTPVEIGTVVLAVAGLLFARRILSSIKALATNAITGIITLVVASWFGFGVSLTPIALAATALAGIPGAILILFLSHGGVAFLPAGASESGQLFVDQVADTIEQVVSTHL
jgi:hypothetical protein